MRSYLVLAVAAIIQTLLFVPSSLACLGVGDICSQDSDCCSKEFGLVLSCSKKVTIVDDNEAVLKEFTQCSADSQVTDVTQSQNKAKNYGGMHIKGFQSNRCIGITGAYLTNGATAVIWDCIPEATNEIFTLEPVDGKTGFQIKARHSSKCLSVNAPYTTNGAGIVQWDCIASTNQFWELVDDDKGGKPPQLRNPESKRCISVMGGAVGNNGALVIWDCINAPNQQWTLE